MKFEILYFLFAEAIRISILCIDPLKQKKRFNNKIIIISKI